MKGRLGTEVMRGGLKRMGDRVRKQRAIEKGMSTSLVGLLVGLFYVLANACGSYLLIVYCYPPEMAQFFPWAVALLNAMYVILLKGRNRALLSIMERMDCASHSREPAKEARSNLESSD